MSYSNKIYEKNGKIPFLFGQESSFSIVCNFLERRGSALDSNFRSEMYHKCTLYKGSTLSARFCMILTFP